MSETQIGNSQLGGLIREIKGVNGCCLADLTVMSPQNDPYRLDTPTHHENGKWFHNQMEKCGLLDRANPIHNRGIHYAILGKAKFPSGKPYTNDDKGWAFLEAASKAARWLGYVPFEKIIDARNAEPIIREAEYPNPEARVRIEAELYLPDVDDIEPRIEAHGFEPWQPYRLVFFGEKTSLDEVLGPLASQFGADLYLPSGEISDTQLARMARMGANDSREMVVLVLADCDPAGYQMAVSIGHKLRAFSESSYPSLNFRVIAPALTVDQVMELGLPSTPLKETEKRADGWREKYGVEQTEIDALATLRPDTLEQIIREAVVPFYDDSLALRTQAAKQMWEAEAQAAFEEQCDPNLMATIREGAETDLNALREKLNSLVMEIEDLDLDLPTFEMPEPITDGASAPALVASGMSLLNHIQVLKDRKNYGGNDSGGKA